MLNIGKKKYRTLQEQVGYNSERIEQIADYLDGLDVQDSVIVLNSLSPLNSEQMKVAEQPLAFIVYDEAIYLKTKEDATYYYFERMMKMELGTVVTLSSAVIAVTKLNGATGITVSSVDVYSKSQIDTSLGLKANVTYVDTELAKKANLSGANFTGPITAPSIVEDMSGYSFINSSDENMVISFASVVKNGNKITFAIAGKVTNISIGGGAYTIGDFVIPSAIGEKLIPISIGGIDNILSTKNINLTNTGYSVNQKVFSSFKTYNGRRVTITAYGLNSLTAQTEYVFRYEETFLLSENLAV